MEEKSFRPLRSEQLWLLTGGILLIAFVAFSFAMYFTRSFMIPFVFSIFLCAMVSPVDNLVVNRWKMPRWCGFIACIMTILFLFTSIFFVGKYAIGSINEAIRAVNIKIPESQKRTFHEVESSFLSLNPVITVSSVPSVIEPEPVKETEPVMAETELAEEASPENAENLENPEGAENPEGDENPENPEEVTAEEGPQTEMGAPAESVVPTEMETPVEPVAQPAVEPQSETESQTESVALSAEVPKSESVVPAESTALTVQETPAAEGTGKSLEKTTAKSLKEKESPQKRSSEALEETIDYWLQKIGINPELLNAKICISSVYAYIPAILRGSLSTLQTFFSFSILVLLFCIFILMGRNPKEKIKNEVYNEIEYSVQKYLNIKFFISFMTGICVYFVFLLIGTPMAFVFGLLAFILNFIPSIGSIIATLLPIPIMMLTMDISNAGLFVAFLFPCLIQNFFGNFLDPKMQGEGLRLHPVTILLALGYFGVIWGVFGMLLAAPMTAALRVFLLEFQMTRWIAQLMGGQMPSMQEVLEMNGLTNKEAE